jgi:hypothetical protein
MPAPRLRLRPSAVPTAPADAPAAVRAAPIDLTHPWPDPRQPAAEPLTHLQWAEQVARQMAISSAFGFGWRSQEADDLVAVAWQTLAGLLPRFDAGLVRAGSSPDQLFRGWAMRSLRTECRREGERLVNGGWYSTTDDPELKRHARAGRSLPPELPRCRTCSEVFFGTGAGPAGEEEDPEDEPAPVTTRHEPRLVVTRAGVPVVPAAPAAR